MATTITTRLRPCFDALDVRLLLTGGALGHFAPSWGATASGMHWARHSAGVVHHAAPGSRSGPTAASFHQSAAFTSAPALAVSLPGESPTISADPRSSLSESAVELQIVALTNQQRVLNGLPPLAVNPQLAQAAQIQAQDMARFGVTDHDLPGASLPTLLDRLSYAGYHFISSGENVASSYPDASSVVNSWMSSPGQRQNVLFSQFTEIGVGVAHDAAGRPFYAQVLGKPLSSQVEPPADAGALLPQRLTTADMTAAQFDSVFQPVAEAPAMSSSFQTAGAAVSGVLRSQVFQGTGAAAGLYAYAFQFDVQGVSGAARSHSLRGAALTFNAAPVATDLTGTGYANQAYVIQDGAVGDLNAPRAAPGRPLFTFARTTWEPNSSFGSLLTTNFDTAAQSPALQAGSDGATLVVLSHQAPSGQRIVGIVGASPADTGSNLTLAYAP